MTVEKTKRRLEACRNFHNAMMIEAALKDNSYLEQIHGQNVRRLDAEIERLGQDMDWHNENFQDDVQGVPI